MFFKRRKSAGLQKYPAVIFSAVLFLIFYFPSFSTDYNFSEISEIEFSTDEYVHHQIVDFNNDGYDELVIMYKYAYYIYSLKDDSILFSDTTGFYDYFCGFTITDYNSDSFPDILLLKMSPEFFIYLYLQDGLFYEESQLLGSVYDFYPYWEDIPVIKSRIYYGDVNDDGENEIFISGIKDDLFGSGMWMFEYSGCLALFSTPILDNIWKMDVAAENTLFLDLNDNNQVEVVSWGLYEFIWYHADMVSTMKKYKEFGIFNSNGDTLLHFSRPDFLYAIGGEINPLTPGDDIIIYKDGGSFDTTIFVPSGNYAFYCFGIPNDSLELLWGIDADSVNHYLFTLPSLPGTFCASTASSQYTIISGEDGQTAGTVNGLRRLSITEEGHFLALPDSVIQVVQIDGDKVYLYQQASPTDISEPGADIIPNEYCLGQNHPNPFNPTTSIEYTLPVRSHVIVSVYNLLGQKISTIVDEIKPLGTHRAIWDGKDSDGNEVASGIYFYQIQADGFVESKKMLLLK